MFINDNQAILAGNTADDAGYHDAYADVMLSEC